MKLLPLHWHQKNYWVQISVCTRLGKVFRCPGYKIRNLMSSPDLFPWGHRADTNTSSLPIVPEGLGIKQQSQNIKGLKGIESEASMFPRILLQDSSCLFSNGFLDSLLSACHNQLYKCPTTLFSGINLFSFPVVKHLWSFFCLSNCFLGLLLFCGAVRDFISQLVLLFNYSCKSVSVQIHAEKTICHKSVKAKWSKQSLRAHCFLSQPTSRPKNILSSFRFWYCPLP